MSLSPKVLIFCPGIRFANSLIQDLSQCGHSFSSSSVLDFASSHENKTVKIVSGFLGIPSAKILADNLVDDSIKQIVFFGSCLLSSRESNKESLGLPCIASEVVSDFSDFEFTDIDNKLFKKNDAFQALRCQTSLLPVSDSGGLDLKEPFICEMELAPVANKAKEYKIDVSTLFIVSDYLNEDGHFTGFGSSKFKSSIKEYSQYIAGVLSESYEI